MMRHLLIALALGAVAASAAAPSHAQASAAAPAAAAVSEGAMLISADGRRIGRITRVTTNAAGQPVAAAVIVDTRFVYIPVTTLTAGAEPRDDDADAPRNPPDAVSAAAQHQQERPRGIHPSRPFSLRGLSA